MGIVAGLARANGVAIANRLNDNNVVLSIFCVSDEVRRKHRQSSQWGANL